MTPKTIANWNNILVELGMSARIDDSHLSKSTVLLPLSNYYRIATNSSLKDIIQEKNSTVDGELIAFYHLFEWRKRDNEEIYDVPYNTLCCVFERKTPRDSIYKFVLVEDEKLNNFKLNHSTNQIFEDVYRFQSEYLNDLLTEHKLESIPHENFVINTKFNLVSPKEPKLVDLLLAVTQNMSSKDKILIL